MHSTEHTAHKLTRIFNDFLKKTQLPVIESSYYQTLSNTTFHIVTKNSHLRLTEDTPDVLNAAGRLWLRTPYAMNPISRPV